MNWYRTESPTHEADILNELYSGVVYKLPADGFTQQLVADLSALIDRELGVDGPSREAQFRLSDGEFFDRIGRLRKAIYTGEAYHRAVEELVRSRRFDPLGMAFDPMRLRVITHRGFENPKAAPIYYAHRDTWYAHSQAEITWWIPLHDVTEEETFVFYPDWFARPVPNNSEAFDYTTWTQHGASLRIGWQNPNSGSSHTYPGLQGEFQPGREITLTAKAGEVLLFAGSHFHQTRKNCTGRTRFSIDLRTVNLHDHAQERGAPNVDNRSTGSALVDYIHPANM